MGLSVDVVARASILNGAPAMAMAPRCLCVAVQHCHPAAANGMMQSLRYLQRGQLWATALGLRGSAQQLAFVRSLGSWSSPVPERTASSKRRARGPIMAAAKKAAGEGE